MKMLNRKPPGLHKKAIGVAAGFFLLALLMPGAATADMAANAVITNSVTIAYDDAAGNLQPALPAVTVSVRVNLITAHPTLSAPIDQATPSGVQLDYTYTITNNSNGLDTYNLTSATSSVGLAIGGLATIDFLDALAAGSITDIALGASSVAAAGSIGDFAITVPNDGSGGGDVNGIGAGDTIVIGVNSYLVASVTDNTAGTSTITIGGAGLIAAISVGDQIGEQGTFLLRATPTTTTSGQSYTVTVTADDGVTALAAPTDATTTIVTLISLTVTKYVRNISDLLVTGAGPTPATINTGLGAGAILYYTSGITANPGQTLEYLIAINNAVGSGTATDVTISDPIPGFTLQAGNIALDPGTGTWADVATTANNGDFAEVVGGTVFIYAGTGGNDTVGGGSLPANTTTYGAFRVTITP